MDGVTVLNVIEAKNISPLWLLPLIVLLIVGFILSYIGLKRDSEREGAGSFIFTLGTLLITFELFFSPFILGSVLETSNTRYEVIIDDSVSMKEFTEKYKVIENRGDIYTVEER